MKESNLNAPLNISINDFAKLNENNVQKVSDIQKQFHKITDKEQYNSPKVQNGVRNSFN